MSDFVLNLSPHRYLKQKGVIKSLAEILTPFGRHVFVFFDPFIQERYGAFVSETLEKAGFRVTAGALKQECCEEEGIFWVDRLLPSPPGSIVGMGGGKTIDLAKWIAAKIDKPFIAIPTSAATCSAVTSISPLYTPEGVYLNTADAVVPSLTLVDPDIMLTQPLRLLASGMADAMAKWMEAKGMRKQHHKRIHTASALSLARLSYEFLSRKGTRALEDLEKGQWTETLSEVVDINLLTTGLISLLGGRKVRVNAAHAFQKFFCGVGSKKDILHGEWVAFGLIVQMILERVSESSIQRHLILFTRWGLPLTLGALGISRGEEYFEAALERMLGESSPIHNLHVPVTREQVRDAILKADEMGGKFLPSF